MAVVVLSVLCLPGGGAGRPVGLSCPATGTPSLGPGRYITQGRFTTFDCGYSDGIHGFDLTVNYYPADTPVAELPAKAGSHWCSAYAEKPYTVYSAGSYAYAQASGSPPNWDTAFSQATAFLGQAAGVAHSCTIATVKKALTVQVLPSQGVYPRAVKLKFRLTDSSGRARAGAVVFQGNRPIYRFPYRWLRATNTLWWFNWKPPAKFRNGVQLTFCVSATDNAGNKASGCANFSVLRP